MIQEESGHNRHQWRRNNQVKPTQPVQGNLLDIEIREGRKITVQYIKSNQEDGHNNDDLKSLDRKSAQFFVASENILIDSQEIPQVGNISANSRPVIFFIHGVGGSSKLWQHQVQYYSGKDYEIIVPDLLGHGLSSVPKHQKAYTFTELANDMLALFDNFAKQENILVGHSYGSSFCVKLAIERRDRVSKVILISGGGPQSLQPQPCQIFCLPACILSCIKPIIVNGFIKRAFKNPTEQAEFDRDNSFNAPVSVLHAMMNGQDWPEGDRTYHADISTPILLIYGTHDQFISLDEEIEMVETIHNCRLETVDAGHMVMLEAPGKVNELINDFILQNPLEMETSSTCPDFAL